MYVLSGGPDKKLCAVAPGKGGNGGQTRTCAKGYYQPRPVWTSLNLTLVNAGDQEVVSQEPAEDSERGRGWASERA